MGLFGIKNKPKTRHQEVYEQERKEHPSLTDDECERIVQDHEKIKKE